MSLILLDYGKPTPFGEVVGGIRNLAWPVNAYRLTMPIPSKDSMSLNAFERVILKLIDAGGARDSEVLAQETCIPKDLVHCVLLRLRDKSYIDDNNEILEQKRKDWRSKEEEPPVFTTALLFRELVGGKILPYLHVLNDENPLKKKEDEKNRFRRIRWDEAHTKGLPIPRDVICAMRAMRKRSRALGDETRLPAVQYITIASQPELYHLDCPIAIQKSDGEFRIADPFCNGFALMLESAFSRLLEKDNGLSEWLLKWRKNISNPSQDSEDTQAVNQKEPYDNDENWGLYRKLIANLLPGPHKQYRSIRRIHAALEWTFFYSCAQRACDSVVQELKLTNHSEHPTLLENAARTILLDVPQNGLHPVRMGKLGDFLSGKASLETDLSLALLMAARDASHPLRRIALMYPDLIIRLFNIKKSRDELGHGTGKVRLRDVRLPEDTFMQEVVAALLPALRFSDAATVAEVDEDAVADTLIAARTSVQSEFGFALFNRLGKNLQDRLIAAERFWLSCNDGDDALALACDLYAALQGLFRRVLAGVVPPDIADSEYSVTAQRNAEGVGLGDLPDCLLTAKRSAIRETLQGNDQSLQSCVVAMLIVFEPDALLAIGHMHSSFITDVAHVIDRRGHGNEPLPLPRKQILEMRNAAYRTMKTLLEA
jgi:hypothetical protein